MDIKQEYLYNIDINDEFFDSLKLDYKDFEQWYKNKALSLVKAYVTFNEKNKIGSFLLLKVEDEKEDYTNFEKPFVPNIRLKVATFKVANSGKKIGQRYMQIIIDEAIKNKVKEIYITVFAKQKELIKLFNEYGFVYKTIKKTKKSNGILEEELVLVKVMNGN